LAEHDTAPFKLMQLCLATSAGEAASALLWRERKKKD